MSKKETKVVATMEDTKDVVMFVIKLGQAIEKSLKNDGEISFKDAPNFFKVLTKAIPAIEGVKNVPMEIADMTPEKVEELKAFVKAELDLEDDKAEIFIEDSFGVVLKIWNIYMNYFAPKPVVDDSYEVVNDEGTANENIG